MKIQISLSTDDKFKNARILKGLNSWNSRFPVRTLQILDSILLWTLKYGHQYKVKGVDEAISNIVRLIPKDFKQVPHKYLYRVVVLDKNSIKNGKFKLDKKKFSSWTSSLAFARTHFDTMWSQEQKKPTILKVPYISNTCIVDVEKFVRSLDVYSLPPSFRVNNIRESLETALSEQEFILKDHAKYRNLSTDNIVE